jgi:thymidylate synthase
MKSGVGLLHTHIYMEHLPQISKQLLRNPKKLPILDINKSIKTIQDIEGLVIDDFMLTNYNPHSAIGGELFTGLKK